MAAQTDLCSLVGDIAELGSAKRLVDVGSGFSAPAAQWRSSHGSLDISCVNINFQQLLSAMKAEEKMSLLNATSTALPLSDESADRIVALESAQHFRLLEKFISKSRKVLKPNGLLIIAMPVVTQASLSSSSGYLHRHGRQSTISWNMSNRPLQVRDLRSRTLGTSGHHVYEPLTDYYVLRRSTLRERILQKYPLFLEKVLYSSLLKMKDISKKIIDYIIIKACPIQR